MNRIRISRLLGWMLIFFQMWIRIVDGTTDDDLWKRADKYNEISKTLRNLIKNEKLLNRQYLQNRSEKWFQDWKTEVFRSSVYEGYLGCNPEQVLHAISLIRSKLENDARTCMDNKMAELQAMDKECNAMSIKTMELYLWSRIRNNASHDLKSEHFDAVLQCLPDPTSVNANDALVPPRINFVLRTGPLVISNWETLRNGLKESRRACYDFHALENHGATSDIVYLFEECVRGDIKDWVHAEADPSEMELQTLFKILLNHAYTRPAQFKRTLTDIFNRNIQFSITTVRKSYVAEMTDVVSNDESQTKSPCRHYLPRLKTLYADLIRNAYRCLHGSYMNYLESKKVIELDAHDINRLTTNSTHQMEMQGRNTTLEGAVYQLHNKVIPTYDLARRKNEDMQQQYENDVLNIHTHLQLAFQCVLNNQYKTDKIAMELSKSYLRCPSRKLKQQALVNKLESDLTDVYSRIDSQYETALSNSFQFLEIWQNRQENGLTITPEKTPLCQSSCAAYAHAQITKLHEESRTECTKHLNEVRQQMKSNVRRVQNLKKFVPHSQVDLQDCLNRAILLSYPMAKSFRINGVNCGEYFASQNHNESRKIRREYRDCFSGKCFRIEKNPLVISTEKCLSIRTLLCSQVFLLPRQTVCYQDKDIYVKNLCRCYLEKHCY